MNWIIRLFFIFVSLSLFSSSFEELERDLRVVDEWDRKLSDRLPSSTNHYFVNGYLNMPSARVSKEGTLGASYTIVPPYSVISTKAQLFSFLEVVGNYRVFDGVADPILTPLGFGDKSDKGVSVKLVLLDPDQTDGVLPGFAFGWEDWVVHWRWRDNLPPIKQVLQYFS